MMFCGCQTKSDETMIRERMAKFTRAYNAGDMEEVLECLDARTRNTYQAMLSIGNTLIGKTGFSIDISDMFSLGVAIMSDEEVIAFGNIEVSLASETKATVNATMEFGADGEKTESDVSFAMVKEDGDWYIAG